MGAYTMGLDLGQARDFSALVVVERVHVLPPQVPLIEYRRRGDVAVGGDWREEFHVRAIKRWPLGTPYTAVVDDTLAVFRTPQLRDAALVVDRSGVGRAVMDLLREAWTRGEAGSWVSGLTITAGQRSSGTSVTKQDLVDGLLVPVTQGRVKVAAGLALADVLERELLAFQQNISSSGRTSYDVERREGQGHGDVATALMLALTRKNWGRPEVVENTEEC